MMEVSISLPLLLHFLLEILVLKVPKQHQPEPWLGSRRVSKGDHHTLSCPAQTKATNKEAAFYCLSPLPWTL